MKFIYTINPEWSDKTLCEMVEDGITDFRINASHLAKDAIFRSINTIRMFPSNCKVYFDLPGSKARIWWKNSNNERLNIIPGETYTAHLVSTPDKVDEILITGEEVFNRIKADDIMIVRRHGRANTVLRVKYCHESSVTFIAMTAGTIGWGYHFYNQLPLDEHNTISSLDLQYIDMLNELRPAFICQSFTDNASMIADLKNRLTYIPDGIYAKIETPYGVHNMRDIARNAYGLIIARDDLSAYFNEFDISKISHEITQLCFQERCACIPASNYFSSIIEKGMCSEEDFNELKRMQLEGIQFVYCNETSKYRDWTCFREVEKKLELTQS